MRQSAFGPVYEPKEISADMLPEVGTTWRDGYSSLVRFITVLEVKERASVPVTWDIKCQETQNFKREFTIFAHGFLSRYSPAPGVE